MAGIYAIINKINGKRYVGSTTTTFERRWYMHRWELGRGTHASQILQRAWKKHGEAAFDFVILENLGDSPDKADLLAREQIYIDAFSPYNVSKTARHPPGMKGRKHSPEAKEKMRQAKLGKKVTDAQLASLAKGQGPKSEETKRKISERITQWHADRKAAKV